MFPTRAMTILGGDSFRDEYSLAFDGTDDYIQLSDPFNHVNISVSAWIKRTDDGTTHTIFSNQDDATDGLALFVTDDEYVRCKVNSTTSDEVAGTLILANTWNHVVATVTDNSIIKVYVNGVLGDDKSLSGSIAVTTNARIGIQAFDTNNDYEGFISEVAVYDKTLSASEVATLYNSREPYNHKEGVCASNLQAWWRMGDGSLDKFGTSNGVIGSITDVSIGPELLVDTGFDDASYWDTPGNITVNDSSNSKAVFTNDANNTRLDPDDDVNAVAGRVYKAVFTIDSISKGALKFNIGGVDGTSRNSAGTYTEYILATGTGYIYLRTSGETSATIDNISVKQLGVNAGVMVNMDAVDIVGDTP